MGKEQSSGSEGRELRERFLERLSQLSESPLEDLGVAIGEFIASRATAGNENGTVTTSLLDQVRASHLEGDFLGALGLVYESLPVLPASKSAQSVVRRGWKELRVLFPKVGAGEKREKVVGQPSPTFAKGTAAHKAMEALVRSGEELSQLRGEPIRLEVEAGLVVGFILGDLEEKEEWDQASFFEEPAQDLDEPASFSHRLEVSFEESLVAPEEGETVENWALKIMRQSVRMIQLDRGRLPADPGEMEAALKESSSQQALLALFEAGHVLFGDLKDLSLISKNEAGDKGTMGVESVRVLPAMNWLSLSGALLGEGFFEGKVGDDEGLLIELPLGNLRLRHRGEQGGGKSLMPRVGNQMW
jgi:hypothetical protein